MNEDKIDKVFETLSLIANDVVPVSRAKIAACLYYKKKIISIGTCQMKTHPFQVEYQRNDHSCFLHAEIDAIKKAINRIGEAEIKKCVLFVCRVRTNTTRNKVSFGLAKPCDGCQKCIDNYGIKEVYYTVSTDDNIIKYETSRNK